MKKNTWENTKSDRRPVLARRTRKPAFPWVAVVLALLVVSAGVLAYVRFLTPMIVDRIVIEAGAALPPPETFLRNTRFVGTYASDISGIDTRIPGDYALKIQVEKKQYPVTLEIDDTTAPAGQPVFQETWVGIPLAPDVFVSGIVDATSVTVSFKSEPDFTKPGDQDVTLVLTDTSGNASEVLASMNVLQDTEKPVIVGVVDLSIFIGESVSYRTGVTVTDNHDPDVVLEIDNSAVEPTTPGTYAVVYSATDRAGNRAEATATLTVKSRPDGYITEEEMYALVDQVFAKILTPGMNDLERMSEIFYWIEENIDYIGTADKGDWVQGAYIGLTRGTGDCFTYFAAAKAMLTRAGYETIPLTRVPEARTRHYWNLVKYNGEWYHYDPLPYLPKHHYVCLLRTDAEVAKYSTISTHMYYIFDPTGVPASATVPLDIERRIIYSG